MESQITREAAWELLRKYNKDPFHLQHALTVEGVMRWYAEQLGFADDVEFWGQGFAHVECINPPGIPLAEAMRKEVAQRNISRTVAALIRIH